MRAIDHCQDGHARRRFSFRFQNSFKFAEYFGPGGIIGGIGFFKHVLDQGGTDDIGLWGGIIASGVFNLIIYYWAVATRLSGEKVDEYVRDVYPPPVAE